MCKYGVSRQGHTTNECADTFAFFLIFFFTDRLSGIILGMRPANERRRYIVNNVSIGWAHA